jgi:hypothetical protein
VGVGVSRMEFIIHSGWESPQELRTQNGHAYEAGVWRYSNR